MEKKKVGFTIGKFAPLHKGHQFLIETGLKEMDKFIIIIYETSVIDISIEKRASWIKKLYPEVNIIYAKNPPMQYGLDEKSVKIQMEYLSQLIDKNEVTHFYSSEKYGEKVAKYLQIIDRRIDNKRKRFPISATVIRKNIEINKNWLEVGVYEDCKTFKI